MMDRSENQDLRRAMRDLLALATMPAAWVGRSPQHIVDGLADLLVATLRAEATYVRMLLPGGERVEAMRAAEWTGLREWLERTEHEFAATRGRFRSGVLEATGGRKGDFRVAFNPIGWEGEGGLVVAASRRPDFPGELDWLLLSVAANQAAVAFQTARLLHDRELAAAEMARSRHELQDFVENVNVGLHWVGADGTILWANQAELQMLGYAAEEYIGRSIAEFHADPATIADILKKLHAGEQLADYPARMRCKDGSARDVLIRSSVYRENGRFVHTRCFTVDVTERKRAEEALRASEERFRSLSACSPLGVFMTDTAGNCTYTNARCQAICGFTAEEAQGMGWSNFVHPEDRGRVLVDWTAKAAGGEEYEAEFRWQRGDEPVCWTRVRSAPLTSDRGELVGHVGTVEDITARRRTEEALRRAEKLAAAGQLAARIAHEINDPVQTLTNLLALIAYKQRQAPGAAPLLAMAEEEIRRVGRITRQMLSFESEAAEPAAVGLRDAIEDAREQLVAQHGAAAKHIRVEYRDTGEVAGHATELRHLFCNLLANAVEATRTPRGVVRVRLRAVREPGGARREGFRIVIADNGRGLRKDVRARLFEPFVTTKAEKGSGLGLWVARGVAEKHEGTLRVRSSTRRGRSGTVVAVFLPGARRGEEQQRAAAQSESAA